MFLVALRPCGCGLAEGKIVGVGDGLVAATIAVLQPTDVVAPRLRPFAAFIASAFLTALT